MEVRLHITPYALRVLAFFRRTGQHLSDKETGERPWSWLNPSLGVPHPYDTCPVPYDVPTMLESAIEFGHGGVAACDWKRHRDLCDSRWAELLCRSSGSNRDVPDCPSCAVLMDMVLEGRTLDDCWQSFWGDSVNEAMTTPAMKDEQYVGPYPAIASKWYLEFVDSYYSLVPKQLKR